MTLHLGNATAALLLDHSDQVLEIPDRRRYRDNVDMVFLRCAENLPDESGLRGHILQHLLIFPRDGHDVDKQRDLVVSIVAGVVAADNCRASDYYH